MYKYLTGFLILLIWNGAFAQNLAPNPNFELFTTCPPGHSNFNVQDWYVPAGSGTSDYFNVCGGPDVDIPSNLFGFQQDITGDAYCGFATWTSSYGPYREYIQAQLDSPTIPGCYQLTIIYSPADESSYGDGIAMLLSNGVPGTYIGSTPQLLESEVQTDNTIWYTLTGFYQSLGGETHVTIGSFLTDAETTVITDPGIYTNAVYFYVDSVAVTLSGVQTNDIVVDIGPDLLICEDEFPITLTSNHPDLTNVWSTEEYASSIEVNAPGMYYLTVLENCTYNVDSILIELIPEPEFTIDDDQTLCSGESFTVNLDGSIGDYIWNDGSTDLDYEITEPGTYQVSLTHTCGEIIEEIVVDFLYPIEIPEIDDYELCVTDIPFVIDLTTLADGINVFNWSDNTSGPGLLVSNEGEYSVVVSNDCFSDMEEFTVSANQELPIYINFEDSIACENEEVVIFPGFAYGDYVWQDGSTEAFYLANGPGEYAVTISNFCGEVNFEFEIVPPPPIVLDLGEDILICPGDSVLVSSTNNEQVIWSTGDVGTSTWVQGSAEVIGEIVGPCYSAFDTILVSEGGSAPVISLPDSLLLCAGDTIILDPIDQDGGISFVWNTGSEESSIKVDTSGIFAVLASNSCGASIDSVYIELGEALPQSSIPDYIICEGDEVIVQIDGGGAEIEWSDGTGLDNFSSSAAGVYWLNLSNTCAEIRDSFEISFVPELITPDLGEDASLCIGDSIVIGVSNSIGDIVWNTSENTEEIIVNSPGIYWLSFTNDCETTIDSIEILDNGDIPMFDLGADLIFCDSDTVYVEMTETNYSSIFWSNSQTGSILEVTDEGIYSVIVINDCGASYDTIAAVFNNEIPEVSVGEDQSICPGDSVQLAIDNTAGEIMWNNGSDAESIFALEEGWYSAMLSTSCGDNIDSVFVSELDEIPNLDLGFDRFMCEGDIDSIHLDFPVDVDIIWSTGEDDLDYGLSQEGIIWAEISNACGVSRDSIILTILPGVEDWQLPNDQLVCDEVSYTIEPENFPDFVQVEWNDGSQNNSLTITESGTYWLELSNFCEITRDSINIVFEETVEVFSLGSADTICSGESIILGEDQGDAFEYLWQDGSGEVIFEVTESGLYELQISNICGEESASVEILVLPNEGFEIEVEQEIVLCLEEDLVIDLSQSLASIILWNDGTNSIEKIFSDPGDYFVSLFNECQDTLINFSLEKLNCDQPSIYIPNIFSPNEDGVNDVFSIGYSKDWDILKSYVSIYNRWGELVFESEDPDFIWDGSFKDKFVNPGVFVYYFTIEFEFENEIYDLHDHGDITVSK